MTGKDLGCLRDRDRSFSASKDAEQHFFASSRVKILYLLPRSEYFHNGMPLIEPKNSSPAAGEKCRSCVDFKSWTKQQRQSLTTSEVRLPWSCETFKFPVRIFLEENPEKRGGRAAETRRLSAGQGQPWTIHMGIPTHDGGKLSWRTLAKTANWGEILLWPAFAALPMRALRSGLPERVSSSLYHLKHCSDQRI